MTKGQDVPTVSDIVKAVIAFSELPTEGRIWRAPEKVIHQALFEAKKQYPELLEHLFFTPYTLSPHCQGIDSVMSVLLTSGCVIRESPLYRYIQVWQEMRDAYAESLNHFPKNVIAKLKKIARMFDQAVLETIPKK